MSFAPRAQIPVMVYLDPAAVLAEGVPWWVILLAVLAGLLVLALLVLLMWKVRLGEAGAGGVRAPRQAVVLTLTGPFIQKSVLSTYPCVPTSLSGPGCLGDKSDVGLVLRAFVI